MEAIEAIMTRRSVRDFTNAPVSEADVTTLLEAAMSAPSAGNQQPWHFVVISDKSLLARCKEANPNAGMADRAPLGILVCGDSEGCKYPPFWQQDCAAAVENLLLAVHALGLGAVWTGGYPIESVATAYRSLFGIPESVMPMALIVVGHTNSEGTTADRFKLERIHRDKW